MGLIDYNKILNSAAKKAVKQFGVKYTLMLEAVLNEISDSGLNSYYLSDRERAIIACAILKTMQENEEQFRDYVINTVEL